MDIAFIKLGIPLICIIIFAFICIAYAVCPPLGRLLLAGAIIGIIIGIAYVIYLTASFIMASPLIILILANVVGLVIGIIAYIAVSIYKKSESAGGQVFLFMTIIAIILNCIYIRTYF